MNPGHTNYIVHRDQAVWERETLRVSIPDNTPEDEIEELIWVKLDRGDYEEIGRPRIEDEVEGLGTEVTFMKED